ncbi:DUF4293 domain-containing protein [Anditalea andensis]|uniref:DUF4293 family protein n=1 Tax=Anditalea andensis TaxID=1048983 RepID=A0A074L0F2_9BACT|nr:DUF4293 domain-containing protein [Anditalea andensis]KEO73353.1 hypothetical protein EL17_13485 [Anditalea andensis]
MIQRVQTIFLFLVAVFMLMVLYFPIWTQINPTMTETVTLTAWSLTVTDIAEQGVVNTTSTIYIALLSLIAAVIAIYSLSQFKNRKKQMKFNMINSLVMVITLGTIVFISMNANEEFNGQDTGAYMAGFYVIIFAMLMNIVSNRYIRKDEMLVRSVDRIR